MGRLVLSILWYVLILYIGYSVSVFIDPEILSSTEKRAFLVCGEFLYLLASVIPSEEFDLRRETLNKLLGRDEC